MSPSNPTNPSNGKPVSVLFVCLGNICRSPMAEGVFRSLTAFSTPSQHPLIARIDSCGTGAYHAGDTPDPRTLSVLTDHNLTTYTHSARRIRSPKDFEEFDYVLGMDKDNVEDLRELVLRAVKRGDMEKGVEKRVMLYGGFGGKSKKEEVVDPYYGGRDGFEIAYEQMERFGKGLLRHIEEEAGEKGGD